MIVYLVKNIFNNRILEVFDSFQKAQDYVDGNDDEFGFLTFYSVTVK